MSSSHTTKQIANVISSFGADSLREYSQGFRQVAIHSLEACVRNELPIDSVTPCILYLLRHSTELFLKAISRELEERHGVTPRKSDHKLRQTLLSLQQDLRTHFKIEAASGPFDYRRWLEEFDRLIKWFEVIDPDGQTLRYPEDKQGNPNLAGQFSVDLRELLEIAQSMDALLNEYGYRDT